MSDALAHYQLDQLAVEMGYSTSCCNHGTMAEESDGLGVLEGHQTQVPKSSLFEAMDDAESAIPVEPPVLKPVARTEHSIGGSTDEEETLEEFDEYQGHVSGRSSRTCCSRRSIIWLAFNAVALAAVSGALLGVLLKSTGVFRPTSTVQSGGGSMTNAPTMSPVINYAPPPTESPPPSESPLPTDPLYKILESFSLGGIDDPSSPQYQAYEWLSKEDHIIDADSSNMDRIQQRYALVTLYVALGIGEIPDASRGECDWPTLECRTMYTTDFFDTVDILSERTKEQQVTEINLAKKSLKGTIPAEISLLAPSLERLDLSENPGLQGSIPDELYDLTQLKFLYLNENSMTGTLSENIGNLQLLEELFLGSNGFTGTIPFNLGSHQGIRPLRKCNMSKLLQSIFVDSTHSSDSPLVSLQAI